ncbi:MAG: Arylesterase precursor, partial [uncultured Lysobacter sp.]
EGGICGLAQLGSMRGDGSAAGGGSSCNRGFGGAIGEDPDRPGGRRLAFSCLQHADRAGLGCADGRADFEDASELARGERQRERRDDRGRALAHRSGAQAGQAARRGDRTRGQRRPAWSAAGADARESRCDGVRSEGGRCEGAVDRYAHASESGRLIHERVCSELPGG